MYFACGLCVQHLSTTTRNPKHLFVTDTVGSQDTRLHRLPHVLRTQSSHVAIAGRRVPATGRDSARGSGDSKQHGVSASHPFSRRAGGR